MWTGPKSGASELVNKRLSLQASPEVFGFFLLLTPTLITELLMLLCYSSLASVVEISKMMLMGARSFLGNP